MTAVRCERRGAALWLTMNRPEKRNAINQAVIAGLTAGLREAAAPGLRAVVLTGAGEKAFCAGGDMQPGGGFQFDRERPTAPLGDLLRVALDCPLPIIARVNGDCLAGGMALLAMADMAIAATHARFGLPEVKVGLFPFQVLALLQDLVPWRVMTGWSLTGEMFDAVAAREAGLVNRIAAEGALDTVTQELIDLLAARSPAAIRRGKYALRAMAGMSVPERIAFAESQLPLMAQSEDAGEGMAAFNERRPPRWKD